MEQQPSTETTAKSSWSRKKIALLIMGAMFLAGALLFQTASEKVKSEAQQTLLARANQAVNGQITAGSIDLSLLGYVKASDVQLLSADGKPLAKLQQVQIRYNWNDLLKGRLGPQLIQAVNVEKPQIWVTYQQEQLNWDGFLKTKTESPSEFAGTVTLRDGELYLATDYLSQKLEQLSGSLDFQANSQITLAAAGKIDQSAVKASGQWGTSGLLDLTVSAEKINLAKLELTKADDPIQIIKGTLDEITLVLGQEPTSGRTQTKALAGRFSNVDTTGALTLTQSSAQFEKQGTAILFKAGQAFYQGQPVTAEGKVLTAPSGEKTLDFAVQMPSGDPAAMMPSLKAGGALAVKGTVTGPVLAPVFTGSFTLGSLQFGSMTASAITGTFSYAQQTLQLLTAKGSSLGGSVEASGNVYPNTEQYSLSVSGSGLDTSQLTDKDVKGPLSFTGTARGSADAATVQGHFTVYNGTAYNIAFQRLTGNFVKRGSAEAEVSSLAIHTDFGVFYPEQLNQSVMEKLQEGKLPATSEEIRETVKGKVTEKLLEKLFR